jgi:hypothetical protein
MSTSLFDCPNKRFLVNSIKASLSYCVLNVRVADCEMPPLIRRSPLSERIKAYLNPYDLLLWIAEELHESALDEALRDWGMPVGIVANLIFAFARFTLKKNPNDDIFGEFESKTGWFRWFVSSSTSSSLQTRHHV